MLRNNVQVNLFCVQFYIHFINKKFENNVGNFTPTRDND